MKEHPRVRLLRYIAEHTAVSAKELKADLGMATSAIYYYLAELELFLKQDGSKRYYVSAEGRLLIDKCGGDYDAATKLMTKLASTTTSMPDLRKYRSVYDTVASVLDTSETVFSVNHIIKKGKMPHRRAHDLLKFMREKRLIEIVDKEDLPSPNATWRERRQFFKPTDKGVVFLRRYKELKAMIA